MIEATPKMQGGRWTFYQNQPPFDGRYLARFPGDVHANEYQLINGIVYNTDGEQVLNFSCEWQRIGSAA